jgi:hypothetical protein
MQIAAIGKGAIAGAIGAVVMIGAEMTVRGLMASPTSQYTIPERVLGRVYARLGLSRRTTATEEMAFAITDHVGVGALWGAVFGGFVASTRSPGFLVGPIFGLATWLIDYVGIGPALNLVRLGGGRTTQDTAIVAASHAIFGAVVGVVFGVLHRSPKAVWRRERTLSERYTSV